MTDHRIVHAALLIVLTATGGAHGQVEVYATDFAKGADGRWSSDRVHTIPAGDNACLGRFTNDAVTLKLTALPEHAMVRVSFDLLLLRTWDGNNPRIGPDSWELKTDDGRVWVDHTFTGSPRDRQAGATQSYPAVLPGHNNPAASGSSAKNNLGYDMSVTYAMAFTFPHRSRSIAFTFRGKGLQDVENESWCLDNVRVEVLAADDTPAPTGEQLDGLVDKLRAADPLAAWQARQAAVALGDRFTAHVAADLDKVFNLKEDAALSRRIRGWIAQLDADTYAKREEASGQLAANIAAAQPLIAAAMKRDDLSPEQRWRLERVMNRPDTAPVADPDRRLALRLVRVLELIGTERATKLLNEARIRQLTLDPSDR